MPILIKILKTLKSINIYFGKIPSNHMLSISKPIFGYYNDSRLGRCTLGQNTLPVSINSNVGRFGLGYFGLGHLGHGHFG